jgi:hypothetical protein
VSVSVPRSVSVSVSMRDCDGGLSNQNNNKKNRVSSASAATYENKLTLGNVLFLLLQLVSMLQVVGSESVVYAGWRAMCQVCRLSEFVRHIQLHPV